MSQLFASGGQSIRAAASASVLPMNIQGWYPLELRWAWIGGLSYVVSPPQSGWASSHLLRPEKNQSWKSQGGGCLSPFLPSLANTSLLSSALRLGFAHLSSLFSGFGLRLDHTLHSPQPPMCKQQLVGCLSLCNHMSQSFMRNYSNLLLVLFLQRTLSDILVSKFWKRLHKIRVDTYFKYLEFTGEITVPGDFLF